MLESTLNRVRPLYRNTRWADWLYRRLKGPFPPEQMVVLRELLAVRYLRGSGIEIGALHRPLRVPKVARVRYVDRYDVPGLRAHYPELAGLPLVPVDMIDDGEQLRSFAPHSVDFIIANHFLEHTQNVFGVLARFLDVVREGGLLFLCVPNKGHTFDRDRPLTTFGHLLRDYTDGPGWSHQEHVREWVRLVEKVPEAEVADRVRQVIETAYSIHYHVWTHDSLCEMFLDCRRQLGLPFDIKCLVENEPASESICVLRRREVTAPA